MTTAKQISDTEIEALARTYRAKDGRVNPQWLRKMNKYPHTVRVLVESKVDLLGLRLASPPPAVSQSPLPVTLPPPVAPLSPPAPPATSDESSRVAPRVSWTLDEWDRLSELIVPMIKNAPGASLIQLTNKAQQQLPEHRRRDISTLSQLGPLQERITSRLQSLFETEEEAKRLRDRVESLAKQPSRNEILDTLSNDELLNRYKRRFLGILPAAEVVSHFEADEILASFPPDLLMTRAYAAMMEGIRYSNEMALEVAIALQKIQQTAERAPTNSNGNGNGNGHGHVSKLPKVALVGPKSDQFRFVTLNPRVVGKAAFVRVPTEEYQTSGVPPQCDIILFWKRFANHEMYHHAKAMSDAPAPVLGGGCRFIHYDGGLERMAQTLQSALKPQNGKH